MNRFQRESLSPADSDYDHSLPARTPSPFSPDPCSSLLPQDLHGQILPRPGYISHLDVGNIGGPVARLETIARAIVTPVPSSKGVAAAEVFRQRVADLHYQLARTERELGLKADPIEDRWQYWDGDPALATVIKLGHYPSDTPSDTALNDHVWSTGIMCSRGVESPAMEGDYRVAFGNLIPARFTIQRPPRVAWRDEMFSMCNRFMSNVLDSLFDDKQHRVLTAYGVEVGDLVQERMRAQANVVHWTVHCRQPARWEVGADDVFTACARRLSARLGRAYDPAEDLTDPELAPLAAYIQSAIAGEDTGMVEIRLALVTSTSGGMTLVMLSAHPEACKHPGSSLPITAMDMLLELEADLLFGGFRSGVHELPTWEQRRYHEYASVKGTAKVVRLKKIRDFQSAHKILFTRDELPMWIEKLCRETVIGEGTGTEHSRADYAGHAHWLLSHRGGTAERTVSEATKKKTAANLAPDPKHYAKDAAREYASCCGCGIESVGQSWTGESPVVRPVRVDSGEHSTRREDGHTRCDVGIPLDDALRDAALYIERGGPKTPSPWRRAEWEKAVKMCKGE